MKYANNVTELVGHTPLVRINRLMDPAATSLVLAKIESFNPASSVKDRIGVAIIDAAQASGQLPPGGTIVEATSGNTGVALAMVGAARGYKVVIAMPSSMSRERRALMRAFGAELILTDPTLGMAGAVAAAEKLVQGRDGAVLASQFTNAANPQIHRHTTAAEIWTDLDGHVDILVAGVGTGGTASGTGARLKELNPNLQVIVIEPRESPLLTTGKAGPHGIQGIGANFVPDNYDPNIIDEVICISTAQALDMARHSASAEGLLVGISSGAALAGTQIVAARPQNAGKTIVVILPDTGERYLTTPLFADLME